MHFTFEQYASFCKKFVEQFFFQFDPENIEEKDGHFTYAATYRDPGNYKISIDIKLDPNGSITWATKRNDCEDATEAIVEAYDDFCVEILSSHAEALLICPKCKNQTAKQVETENTYGIKEYYPPDGAEWVELDDTVEKYECTECHTVFYL